MIKLHSNLFRFALAAVMVLSSATSSLAQQAAPKFSIAISGPRYGTVDSALWIRIKITNTSEEPISLNTTHHGNLPDAFKFLVRDEEGNLILENPLCPRPDAQGKLRQPCSAPGSFRTGFLRPGETWETAARLSDKYNIDRAGKYTIQVWRQEPGMPIIYSNAFTLAVFPRP